jgi:hypothetical protein
MKFRITLITALISWVLLFGLIPTAASAEPNAVGAPGFKNVTLWVYPEYDDPRLLVMLEGKITSTPPVEAKFLVPSAAEMYSAGSKDAQGKYSGGPPNRVASQIAGWDEISYEVKTDTFRVEYYDPSIAGQTDKNISYDFRFLSSISDLRVIIQQPLKASNFLISPPGTQTFEDQFAVNTYSFTNPDPAEPIHFDISYAKTDSNPSVQKTPTPLAPLIPSDGTSASASYTPGIILGLPMLVIGVFAVILIVAVRRGRRRTPRRLENRRPLQLAVNRRQPQRVVNRRYCIQCGTALDLRSKFCQSCGQRV